MEEALDSKSRGSRFESEVGYACSWVDDLTAVSSMAGERDLLALSQRDMELSKVSCPRRMFPVRFGGASDTLIVKRTRSEESDEKDGCWHMVCAPHFLGSGARSKIPVIPTTGYQQFSLLGRSEPGAVA